jgi:hypothetical protein
MALGRVRRGLKCLLRMSKLLLRTSLCLLGGASRG